MLRKARTNLEVSLPWRPVWDGVGVPVLMPWGWTQMAHTLWWLLQSAEGQLGEACGGTRTYFPCLSSASMSMSLGHSSALPYCHMLSLAR